MKSQTSTIFVVFLVLVVLGLYILASVSYFKGIQKFEDGYFYLKRQLFYSFPIALMGFLFFYFFNYKYLKKLALIIFIASLILLSLVFVPGLGQTKGQASCWINIFGINFQPAEFAKIGFIIYLAAFFSAKGEKAKKWSDGFFPVLIIILIISIFFVLQSDLGMLALFIVATLGVYFLAKSSLTQVVLLLLLLLIGGYIMTSHVPYAKERLNTFLNPEDNLQGKSFQVNQAMIAISSGGLLGKGLGGSSQKLNVLPEVVSDSIFAILAEELGFLASSLVILIYLFLFAQIFILASRISDQFGKLLIAGLGFFIFFQFVFNIGGNIGRLPLTGVPLPFMGYGGSNLLFLFSSIGIILNVSKYKQKKQA